MRNKSNEKFNIYQNKPFKLSKNRSKNITYNKPLFINMKNENSNKNNTYNKIQKNSSCSTKIFSSNSESSIARVNGNNTSSRVYSVKDFDIEQQNYLKTSLNFFSKYINTSISSSEDYNNKYETLSPSRKKNSTYIEEDKEQFTPYLGQKDYDDKERKKFQLNKSLNTIDNNNKYKKIIESASLNLRNHFDEQLSNKYKKINKFQKLSFYQKKKGINNKSRNKTNKENTNYSSYTKLNSKTKALNKQILYKKKSDLSFHRENERKILEWFYIHNIYLSQREIYEKNIIIIQAAFRGYISRIKLYNKLKLFTCITVFNQILNNIYFHKSIYNLKICFRKILKFGKNNLNISKKSFTIAGDDKNKNKILCEEIKELIDQNNNMQIKLNQFLINNNILKNDISNYKEFEVKYNKLLIQLEKLQNSNNNILKENNRLIKELNIIKRDNSYRKELIEPQNVLNMIVEPINKMNVFKNIFICKNMNDFEIRDINKHNNNKIDICSYINSFSVINNNKYPLEFKNLSLCKNYNQIEINSNKFRKLEISNDNNNTKIIGNNNNFNNNQKLNIDNQKLNNSKINFNNFRIENQENFNIIKSLKKNIFIIEKNNNINIINKNNIENKNLIKEKEQGKTNSISDLDNNKPYKDILSEKNNICWEQKENLNNMRNSLRISLRNERIESQEVNLELEESNLSKEEILKRKRLRNLFKNKLFLLRDITRKYFLRFYYNGIYLKMVGKTPKYIEKFPKIKSEDIINKKRRNTSFIEKGQYLRKIMSQKAKEKKDKLKKYFNLFKQDIDFDKIKNKLIKQGKKLKRNKILFSIINNIEYGNLNLSNIKRCIIVWKYKAKIKNINDIEKNIKNDIDGFSEEIKGEKNQITN